jgi:hypothetical protein
MQRLAGLVVKVKKSGQGIKTKYTIVATPKVIKLGAIKDIPSPEEIVSRLGPEDRQSIIDMIVERSGKSWEELTGKSTKDDNDGVEEL